jgi:dienelactone hydrolase
VSQRPHYLELAGETVFATLHEGERRSGIGVLISPPFGWEQLDSHRTLLRLAERLAQDGHVALRLDLPRSGDSRGEPEQPGMIEAARDALAGAAEHLRTAAGATRIVAFGVGFGGILGCWAHAQGAPIDDLALWAVPARGSRVLRELRAFSRAIDELDLFDPTDAPEDGGLEVAGFPLAPDAVAALESLDISALREARVPARVLLLGRDGLAPDETLGEHFERGAAELTAAQGPSYGAIMGEPSDAPETATLIATTSEWIGAGETSAPAGGVGRVNERDELVLAELRVRETPIELDQGAGTVRGILARPRGQATDLCAVVIGAGTVRRIGLGRASVALARRWAARGIPTVRVDLPGIGDSDGEHEPFRADIDGLYRRGVGVQVAAVLAALARTDLPQRYLLVGQCSGAYWAFHRSLADPRVRATVLVNPPPLKWPGAALSRRPLDVTAYLSGVLRRLARGRLSEVVRDARERKRLPRIGHSLARRISPSPRRRLGRQFASLHARGTLTHMVIGRDEPVEAEIAAAGAAGLTEPWPGVTIERLPFRDHTILALAHQRAVAEAVDRALEQVLSALEL